MSAGPIDNSMGSHTRHGGVAIHGGRAQGGAMTIVQMTVVQGTPRGLDQAPCIAWLEPSVNPLLVSMQ